LQLLEITPALGALEGVKMELDDCAFPLLTEIVCTDDADTAFGDADVALLVGAMPRKAGMERSDLLSANGGIFKPQGEALSRSAKRDVKVLVVGNPANTNALIAQANAADLDPKQFTAMTRLDHNRAKTQLAQKLGVTVNDIKKMTIWGNHSATQYPDFANARIGGKPAPEVIADQAWIQGEFLTTVQQRGAEIIKARGASSAASAANAVVDTVRNITQPTGEQFSAAIAAPGDGSGYGVPEGIVFGYPLRATGPGRVSVVQGVQHGEWGESKIQATLNELLEEREAVKDLLP